MLVLLHLYFTSKYVYSWPKVYFIYRYGYSVYLGKTNQVKKSEEIFVYSIFFKVKNKYQVNQNVKSKNHQKIMLRDI